LNNIRDNPFPQRAFKVLQIDKIRVIVLLDREKTQTKPSTQTQKSNLTMQIKEWCKHKYTQQHPLHPASPYESFVEDAVLEADLGHLNIPTPTQTNNTLVQLVVTALMHSRNKKAKPSV